MNAQESASNQRRLILPNGTEIIKSGPVVIVGPNGSGKSRKSREIRSDVQIEVVSALRNTRIAQQLQPMALQQAKQNFINQRDNARSQPYELANDFDYMLTALIGEAAESSLDYLASARKGTAKELPALSTLEQIQSMWTKFFPGRELEFRNYLPQVTNTVAVGDEPASYSAWQMSDGEKAALYLAGRALSADKDAVLLVDEPETHLHSLLAVQFWDEIELARPDLRLIYVTHDMTFAASRKAAQYLLANPLDGLRPIELASDAGDLAAVLLGTASLSFYATRVIFCEGDAESLDSRLYSAWFNTKSDVVQAVGSCESVVRSVAALSSSDLVANLTVNGIVDRDFRSDDSLDTMHEGIFPLGVHEIESLFALPDVVASVAEHMTTSFDRNAYEDQLTSAYGDDDRHKVVLERWKLRVGRSLSDVVSVVTAKNDTLENLAKSVPDIFNPANWSFSPAAALEEEKARIEGLFDQPAQLAEILRYMPGKKLRPIAASQLGMKLTTYDNLIIKAIGSDADHPTLGKLSTSLRAAIAPYLPIS